MLDLPEVDLAGLDADFGAVLDKLGKPPPAPTFTLPENRFFVHKRKAEQKAARRGIKQLIRPEKAEKVLEVLPASPEERTHELLVGDFVLCDLIPAILRAKGPAQDLHIATLGMSSANADTIVAMQDAGLIRGRVVIVCSHYFQQVDRATTYLEVSTRLKGRAEIIVSRCHAKVICLPLLSGDRYVIEGSANLRSSDNLEQIVIFNDSETLNFHRAWMEALPRG